MALLNPVRRRAGRLKPLGVLEALATPHGVDRYLELVHPMLTVREPRAEVTAVAHPTPDSVALTLRPNRHWRGFRAGQFVQIALEIDGVRHTRCFSPCSAEGRPGGRFELIVKAQDGGLVSQHLLAHARPGLVLGIAPAAGGFTLPDQRPERLLLISGGSGITPVLSMLRTLVAERHAGHVVFLHYARTAADVPHRDELRALAGQYPNVRVVLASTRADDGDLTGRFDGAHLAEIAPWYAEEAPAYVCGPAPLMTAVREHYADKGLEQLLHTEEFTPPQLAPADGDATGAVSFGSTTVENSGATLLEQAEAAGLTPEYGCRMGICFTCTKVKTAGCTRNVLTGDVHSRPEEEIQLCISVPVGDVAIDL